MTVYALDTNIVSYFLKGNENIIRKIQEEKEKGEIFVIPPMVYYEIQNWLMINNSRQKMTIFEKMYSDQGIGVIDKSTLDTASKVKVKLKKAGITIGDDDIFIAAYCIKHNFMLVTNNAKHFKTIKNLEMVNWKE
jgi:predicted nucleic acid-binding protein